MASNQSLENLRQYLEVYIQSHNRLAKELKQLIPSYLVSKPINTARAWLLDDGIVVTYSSKNLQDDLPPGIYVYQVEMTVTVFVQAVSFNQIRITPPQIDENYPHIFESPIANLSETHLNPVLVSYLMTNSQIELKGITITPQWKYEHNQYSVQFPSRAHLYSNSLKLLVN